MGNERLWNPERHGDRAAVFLCTLVLLCCSFAHFVDALSDLWSMQVFAAAHSPHADDSFMCFDCGFPTDGREVLLGIMGLALAAPLFLWSGLKLALEPESSSGLRRDAKYLLALTIAFLGITAVFAFDYAISSSLV